MTNDQYLELLKEQLELETKLEGLYERIVNGYLADDQHENVRLLIRHENKSIRLNDRRGRITAQLLSYDFDSS